ncbi:Rho-type gtpase-activating protein [Didymosphaeria variabile]|uniref:Rho-type gtpase-activating protein n=1 Tax=Didymosphaeria variabile TaxID=1932322 RepID=A0A9W8XM71_9PLEO|nr:Rho-type gtpase-activating protein [Didymosphaeria variabile]KAJ4354146.1 Rho-type gtpase-activating protein [Didymosphaeria variabile]
MESPGGYPESPLDQDDVVYPCKGCGEILEEGKAFELAGNRWHIDCFRCNTCGTLLDSDANLLLLGDGSLICNNCTYSCNHCGNKIEDLAILTGDQAFCANCFRCRNCKRKIENLRYARTSQGIFCMSCHESLMARRRKKTKKPPSSSVQPKVDKSLPALPPSAATQFTPDIDTPSDVFSEPTTTDVSPRPPQPRRNESSPANFRREASPASQNDARRDNVTLPASTYRENNHTEVSDNGDEDGTLLPFALDPNPAPGPSPINNSHSRGADAKAARDYFNRPVGGHREMLKENRSRSASAERQPTSPHIAYQEKGRQPSEQLVDTLRKRKDGSSDSPAVSTDRTRSQHASPAPSQSAEAFKLQEVPKNKRAEARKNSTARSPSRDSTATDLTGRLAKPPTEAIGKSPAPVDTSRDDSSTTSSSSFGSTQQRPPVERPARGDSLANSSMKSSTATSRKEISTASPTTPTLPQAERKPSTTSSYSQQNGLYGNDRDMDPPGLPQRAPGRRPPPSTDTFVSPRAPPQPPPAPQNHKTSESVGTMHSDGSNTTYSAGGLPRYSAQGDFSMDEDFARLLSHQEGHEKEGGMLRKVSNAVKSHGRSHSDRGSITSRGHGHKKWPTNGSIDISSPTIASPNSNEEAVNLRNELRRAQQRIAELEAEKNGLQETVHSAADIKQANTMLREKRNTMAVLDTQREMVIRELEIMTEHLKKAKENSGSTMDINQLKSDILRDFANSLQKLKDQLGGQIEELISKRTALTDEISNLIQMKDKGFQEYESLSAQNKKLADMNQNLIEQIQSTLKTNKQHIGNQSIDAARSPANGLGIYSANYKGGKSDISVDAREVVHEPSYSNLHEADSEATLAQPQVVNIRKTGKATKFSNWKKGGQAITKNVTKGFKGAFGPTETKPAEEMNIKVIGTPYGSTHTQPDFASMTTMTSSLKSREEAPPRGWFGAGKAPTNNPRDRAKPTQHENSSTHQVDASVLFGSDLIERCEYEKRMLPAIVSRCIEEVETRGMDVEGIYRKSGGSSQVNHCKSGFEANDEFDISDPDLDIHAVTSTLKNYFRRLPTPLITYAHYDQFLDAGVIENPEQRARALRAVLKEIPRPHYDTLQFLIFHLARVIQHSKDNLMTPLNLAVVFAPTIMRPTDINRELTDMQTQRNAVQTLLEDHKNVFFDED